MMQDTTVEYQALTYAERMEALRETKIRTNLEKQELTGSLNGDDLAVILPPEDRREVVETISGSGMPITDVKMTGVEIKSNHPDGSFYGPKACGENFGSLLRNHPVYVDPMSSLAGAYMTNFGSFRKGGWKPELDYSHMKPEQEKYGILPGIGAPQHFCQDLTIGLEIGWNGIRRKIEYYREENPTSTDFYDGLTAIVDGIQDWISRNAAEARRLAETENEPTLKRNLEEIAEINKRLCIEPPRTFREACQWMVWYQMAARMYNGSGSLGKLDLILTPFFERDTEEGTLTDEEAIFHVACLLLRDTAYIQIGGPDGDKKDITNWLSFLILESAHRLKIPCNIAICYGKDVDPALLRRGVEIMFEDKLGIPKFLGIDNFIEGFANNGYPLEIARNRAYSGCHWCALPGREYTLNDCVKINFGKVFMAAFEDIMKDPGGTKSVAVLWDTFKHHFSRAIDVLREGLDFQVEHMHEVFPELMISLLSHGPIEKGIDASHGGVDNINLCIDGSALATVADSFAAVEQRVEREGVLAWDELQRFLGSNWEGPEGERARLMMKNVSRFGSGGSRADEWAREIESTFTDLVKERPTPNGHNMIPGLFSWANTIPMGKELGATPNGRRDGDPISHGANPDPGFRSDGAPTAMAVAIASVQPKWGNSAPMQIELDPGVLKGGNGVDLTVDLIKTHFDLGGTQINMNILDKEKLLAAHEDPSLHPDLIVRVTGFSAYFNRLSPEFRQLVVDRYISEG